MDTNSGFGPVDPAGGGRDRDTGISEELKAFIRILQLPFLDKAKGTTASGTGTASASTNRGDKSLTGGGSNEFKGLDLDQLGYLSRLGAQGLDSLNGEVSRLNEELAICEHQTRDIASQNYQIFVQSAQTTNNIKTSLDEGHGAVGKLSSEALPSVKKRLETFSESPCNNLLEEKKAIDSLFKNEEALATTLEMPLIARKCLAEEKLPNAIKVLQTAQDAMKNVSNPPPILISTCEEVTQLKSEIQQALLAKLSSGNIGISECLQTVSLLRNFFPDDKALRFRFLQSRMKDVPFEAARSWIFDTLTQHRAAFGGDSSHYLSTWVPIQMDRSLADIERHIEHGEGLDSLMMQSVYFGESLARVGADVRGLIIPTFAEYLVKRITHDLTMIEIQFVKNLNQFNLSNVISSNTSANLDFPDESDLNPPQQILLHTPIATYLNDVINLLNIIGKCPITQTAHNIVSKLNASVTKIGHELNTWGENEWFAWDAKEQTEFNRMKRYFEHLVVPHLDKVLRHILPPTVLTEVTGLNIAKCAEVIRVKYVPIQKQEAVEAS